MRSGVRQAIVLGVVTIWTELSVRVIAAGIVHA
jgi:hypothetical protein